jgi:preprotein translocase subunit YajC
MFKKAFPVVLLVLFLAAPAFAIERDQRLREKRMNEESVFAQVVRVIKKVVANGDGIILPTP